MKNCFLKKLPTLVAAAIISLAIGTTYAALNHVSFGSPLTSAAWNEMVDEINLKISSFTEVDPKVGSLSVSYFPKWSSASNALINSSLYESADTKLVAKGVDQGVSNYVANFIDSLSNSLLLVRNDGKVGIGTTTPSQKLEVNGIIKSSVGGVMFPDGTIQTTAASPNYQGCRNAPINGWTLGTAPFIAADNDCYDDSSCNYIVSSIVNFPITPTSPFPVGTIFTGFVTPLVSPGRTNWGQWVSSYSSSYGGGANIIPLWSSITHSSSLTMPYTDSTYTKLSNNVNTTCYRLFR